MQGLQQVDDRRKPWVAHAGGQIALIAGTLPGAHDEGHRLSMSLLNRFKGRVLANAAEATTLSTTLLLDAVRSAFSGVSGVEGWGLQFGVANVTKNCWRVWTVGLVYCVQWSPGEWKSITEPQSAARQLREQGGRDVAGIADELAIRDARPSTNPEGIEYAEVARAPMTGVVLLGSMEAGLRLGAAASDPAWSLMSAAEVVDPTAPLVAGTPLATLAALVDVGG